MFLPDPPFRNYDEIERLIKQARHDRSAHVMKALRTAVSVACNAPTVVQRLLARRIFSLSSARPERTSRPTQERPVQPV